jgi:hypothetical protein
MMKVVFGAVNCEEENDRISDEGRNPQSGCDEHECHRESAKIRNRKLTKEPFAAKNTT